MRRLHLFEFGDQTWVPKIFRKYLHELLQYQVCRFYRPIIPILLDWIKTNNIDKVTDLASGKGGPWPYLIHEIQKEIPSFQLELSDINPYPIEGLEYNPNIVDLRNPASIPKGALTIFTGFHHLKPTEVEVFLNTVSNNNQPLFMADFVERKPLKILGMILSPVVVLIDTVRIKPFSFLRILFTYLIPMIPLMYMWDGAISHARAYSISELNKYASNLESTDYVFEFIQTKNEIDGLLITGFYSGPKILLNG